MASQLTINSAGPNDFMDGYYEDENLIYPYSAHLLYWQLVTMIQCREQCSSLKPGIAMSPA